MYAPPNRSVRRNDKTIENWLGFDVTYQGELSVTPLKAEAREQNFSIPRQQNPPRLIICRTDRRGHFPIVIKRSVQAAVEVVPCEGKVRGAAVDAISPRQDFP